MSGQSSEWKGLGVQLDDKEIGERIRRFDYLIEDFKVDHDGSAFLNKLVRLFDENVSIASNAAIPLPGSEQPEFDIMQGFELGKPGPQAFGVSPKGAEHYVKEWLIYWGQKEVNVTPFGKDGGYDVVTEEFLVQVKNWTTRLLPVTAIREIFGVSQTFGKRAMIVSRGPLSDDASDFADQAGVLLFRLDAEEGKFEPQNPAAFEFWETCIREKTAALLATYYVQLFDTLVNTFLASTDGFERGLQAWLGEASKLFDRAEEMETPVPLQPNLLANVSEGLQMVLGALQTAKESLSSYKAQLEEMDWAEFLDNVEDEFGVHSVLIRVNYEKCLGMRNAISDIHQKVVAPIVSVFGQ